jgi:hypothetical protein
MKFILLLSALIITAFAHAELRIENNSADSSLNVQSSRLYYNFGIVPVNSANTVRYTITNTGTTFLQFSSANIWGMDFSATHDCSVGMQPGQRCDFQIRYWPFRVGTNSGQFEILFYGPTPNPEVIHVDLWGEAVFR